MNVLRKRLPWAAALLTAVLLVTAVGAAEPAAPSPPG
jgi:hypothetical protein